MLPLSVVKMTKVLLRMPWSLSLSSILPQVVSTSVAIRYVFFIIFWYSAGSSYLPLYLPRPKFCSSKNGGKASLCVLVIVLGMGTGSSWYNDMLRFCGKYRSCLPSSAWVAKNDKVKKNGLSFGRFSKKLIPSSSFHSVICFIFPNLLT